MPNWCNNNFSISGSTETIQDLWESAQKTGGLLSAVRPLPEILEGTTSPTPADIDPVQQRTMIAQTGCDNWYDWQVKNWGTKWDVSIEGLEFTDNGDGTAMIEGWFDSAWSPPIEAYEQMADDFDSCYISATYHEPGMDFAGVWDSEGDCEMFDGISGYLDNNEPDLWSPLARQLDEEYGIMESIEMWREEEDA
jgi:hypothetical protein